MRMYKNETGKVYLVDFVDGENVITVAVYRNREDAEKHIAESNKGMVDIKASQIREEMVK